MPRATDFRLIYPSEVDNLPSIIVLIPSSPAVFAPNEAATNTGSKPTASLPGLSVCFIVLVWPMCLAKLGIC